ncbi:DUF4917 family protein [Paracoccus aminophilus]|uniref:SIR2-like domain-containing protein n=1 Tax=Paracoccus aminophilus JCM 7686 TaxID=1367847 RepID=S5XRE6_PARAH|nr:DUF4917 family protein [Paracoccus aminophilus]AGT07642.1 hypothetical protein JCM7686_0533 [Paracoccus aminophilus JCM 7686]
MKKVIVFGNGLGRAIDNDFYSLTRVLRQSWADDDVVSREYKRLISNCLNNGVFECDEPPAPTKEDELSDLQRVIDACDTILQFEAEDGEEDVGWLTDYGRKFPAAIRRYFHHAASQFHDPDRRLPEEFAKSLRAWVIRDRPTVATLNYDDLLYECFTETRVFKEHMLRDGFLGGKFDIERHEKLYNPKTEGWFLHLHGSPLFVNRQNAACKITRAKLAEYRGESSVHLVLTNADAKPGVIFGSEILRAYWLKFEALVQRAEEITLFGYGGGDLHLNSLLARTGPQQTIRVICRAGARDDEACRAEWVERLTPKPAKLIDVIPCENVLMFNEW